LLKFSNCALADAAKSSTAQSAVATTRAGRFVNLIGIILRSQSLGRADP
jgi:hypothetical protein